VVNLITRKTIEELQAAAGSCRKSNCRPSGGGGAAINPTQSIHQQEETVAQPLASLSLIDFSFSFYR
jgi:hypothetical protein